jgi:hypothetical protein
MLFRFIQKAGFPVTRHLIFAQARMQAPARLLTHTKSSFHTSNKQLFASDWQQPPQHPIIEKLQQHPHIMQQLVDFTALLQAKGVDVSGKQPSFMQVMKVMSDPEVKEKVKVMAQDMQAAGIQLDMQTIQELQSDMKGLTEQYTQSKEQVQAEEEPVTGGEKKGVMDRVKGIFKK